MLLGSEILLNSSFWKKKLKSNRLAYLGNSASVDQSGQLILSQLFKKSFPISCLFNPQHGFYANKQANMITTENSRYRGLKMYSLYSQKTRRLTPKMKKLFDTLIFDLQDTGCRIYTYMSTLIYLLEDLENSPHSLILLDRPNPLGRFVEGSLLKEDFKSFVGVAPLPLSHGLTLGELALWYKDLKNLKTDLTVIKMKDYNPKQPWPKGSGFVLPSPNITSLDCIRCYPGAVLLEGTALSEGRGTNLPFQLVGRPLMKSSDCLQWIQQKAKKFKQGCFLRETAFEPQFDKFKNKLCSGFQIHLEKNWIQPGVFRPYRLISAFLKAFHQIHPSLKWKSPPPYEYEEKLDPIDIISGGPELKNWIQDPFATANQWDDFLKTEESFWEKQKKHFHFY